MYAKLRLTRYNISFYVSVIDLGNTQGTAFHWSTLLLSGNVNVRSAVVSK